MATLAQHEVSFFKPVSDYARSQMKLIITMVVIWAVGVFGFQVLLMVLNKPTPEKTYLTFNKVWPAVVKNTPGDMEIKKDFLRVVLSVLGKNVAVKKNDRLVLGEALSWGVYHLMPAEHKALYREVVSGGLGKEKQAALFKAAAQAVGLNGEGFDKLMVDLIPSSLVVNKTFEALSGESRQALPAIMEKYLVHNQNALTDARFLGFPFHYWYTAQFLLIMFVLICLVYAVVIDRTNRKLGLEDDV